MGDVQHRVALKNTIRVPDLPRDTGLDRELQLVCQHKLSVLEQPLHFRAMGRQKIVGALG